MTTDRSGRFFLKNLEAGRYRLAALRNGFARQEYGQKALNRPGTTIVLAAGQKMSDVLFQLAPAATISGRVLDEDGQPVPAVHVQLLRKAYSADGKATINNSWEEIDPGAYFDPDFLRTFEAKATRVTIAEGSRETVTLRVIPAGMR